MRTKIGLIGLGRIGNIHLNNLLHLIPEIELVGVADIVYEEEKFKKEHPGIFFTNDVEELLSKKGIEGVVICTPTSTHSSLVKSAIRYQKDIFCEKPLDFSLSVTINIFELAKKAGVNLMIGFNRRFDPDIRNLREAVQAGKIGKPTIVKITNRDPELPPPGFIPTSGGMFMDFTIHDFDTARYLSGRNVQEVYALGSCFIDKSIADLGDIDTALVNLTLDDGSYVVIDNSRKAVFGYDQRIEIFGKKGMLELQNKLYHQNILFDEAGIHRALPYRSFKERYKSSYLYEMQKFVRVLKKEEKLTTERYDIIETMKVVYAARKSLSEGRVVKLSEIQEPFD